MKVCRLIFFALVLGSLLNFTLPVRGDDVTTVTENSAPPELSKAPPLPAVFSKAQPESIEDLKAIEKQVKEVVAKVSPCTVCIRAGAASGSGVLISPDGLILTAGHVSVADFEARMMAGDLTRITNGVAKHVQPGAWTIIATDGKQLALHPIDVTASGPTRVEFTPTWQPIPR